MSRKGRRTTRAERTAKRAARDARRDSLAHLLSRAQRGVLSRAEGSLLRAHVEAELTEGDLARANAGGTQAAAQRYRHQLAAAEDAIRENEQRALDAEEQLRAWKAVFGDGALDEYRAALARAEQAEQNAEEYRAQAEHAEKHRAAAEQQLAAVRATLPTEPRPALGLPNDLAYTNGQHDQADAVRAVVDEQTLAHP